MSVGRRRASPEPAGRPREGRPRATQNRDETDRPVWVQQRQRARPTGRPPREGLTSHRVLCPSACMDRSSPSPQREAALPPACAAASAMPPPVAVAFPSVLHQLSIGPLPPLPVAVAARDAAALLDAGGAAPPFTPVASADAGGPHEVRNCLSQCVPRRRPARDAPAPTACPYRAPRGAPSCRVAPAPLTASAVHAAAPRVGPLVRTGTVMQPF